MGYQTDFDGYFTLSPLPDGETLLLLQDLDGADPGDFPPSVKRDMPRSYNQWQLTADGRGLQWDGNEKFYHYVEWLQYLLDHVLTPAGVSIAGAVKYWGEKPDDSGTLIVIDRRVHRRKNAIIDVNDLGELRAFKDFAIEHDRNGSLLSLWQEHKRQQIQSDHLGAPPHDPL